MKLAKEEDVIARLNLGGTLTVSNPQAVSSALEAATSLVESILRTSLKEATRIDFFDYSGSKYGTFHPFSIYTTQGYLSGKPKVYYSKDGKPIISLSEAALVDSSSYVVDNVKGKITLLEEPPYIGNSVIAVKYSAGFSDQSSDVPSYIKEAAISAAVYILHTQSVAHGKKDKVNMSKPLSAIVYNTLNEYIFTPYDGFGPVRSQEL